MGIHVEWDNQEKTAIRQTFEPHWTWDDFYAAKFLVDCMIDRTGQSVGLILDMPANGVIPPDALSHGKYYVDSKHSDLCLIVIVSTNKLTQTLYDLFGKVYPSSTQQVRMVNTLNDARKMLFRTRVSRIIF